MTSSEGTVSNAPAQSVREELNIFMEENQDRDVDVEAAERAFAELRRYLSESSSAHLSYSSQNDPEMSETASEFDLLAYLRGRSEMRDQHEFKHKEMGVRWNQLGVVGAGGIKLMIRTFPKAVMGLFLFPIFFVMMRLPRFRPTAKQILHSFTGCLKPGELCLVLGRPNSGCSTFLKVIANQRFGYHRVDGEVSYGSINAQEMAKRYRGEVVYNPEDDVHHATLTVGQTMDFALSTKTPGKLLPQTTRKTFRREVGDTLLKMLSILHTKDTPVGDAQFRGVSGGERKRVSIAEMMTTGACVMSWDNSTRGLDASTALQYAKSLRIVANIFKVVTFVTLYQAGEGIYDQFDKVCLIDEGRQIYFGPAKEARQYMINLGFKNLPRQTTADYLTGCTDVNERQFQDGIDVSKVPKTPEELEKAYLESDVCRRMIQEMQDYGQMLEQDPRHAEDFKTAVKDEKQRWAKRSPYTISFLTQLKVLILREIRLRLQDRKGLIFSWISSTAIAIVIGSVFINLPQTTAGAFTRGGVMFLGLLFNVFTAFGELPKQMLGRPILWRQAGFCFYRPGALAVANALAEVPFASLQILVFCGILYLMANLVREGGAFFTFYVLILVGYLAFSCFFRLLGAISFSFDIASRIASAIVVAMVLYSGYVIPQPAMKRWLVWLYYINPANWAFAALMGNEFGRIDLTCVGTSVVPRGPGFPTLVGPNQGCTMRGSIPGQPNVSGEAYIQASYTYSRQYIWRNFGFELGYIVLFLVLLFIAVEKLSLGAGSPAVNVFAEENAERKRLNERLQERKQDFRSGKAEQDLTSLIKTRKPFTWEALSYDVSVPGGHRRLLNEVYGYVKPGTLTALMGSSGAGKTTLLDVLANRKTTGVIGGDIRVSGLAPGPDFQRGTAYCEQQDVHEWTSTVREAFRFSAYLRQSADISKEEKDAYVEEVIQLLEMEDLADAMIGFPGFGLGVEARKRVTVGVELAAKPQLLLFLDEPTSGLDGQSAYNIVRFLRKLASAGQAILCTIHQPNALLFENFDRLLLLKKGGRCVYFGEIGQDSKVIRSYFERHGAICPQNANPAEFMLEAVGAGTAKQMGGDKDWADRWLESKEHEENIKEIQRLKTEGLEASARETEAGDSRKATSYATTPWFQLRTVVNRTTLAYYRNADYQLTRLFNHISIGLIVGLTFLNLQNSVAALQFRVFCIFIVGVFPVLIIAQVEPMYLMARTIHIRELSSMMYSPEVFALSQFVSETPYSVLCAVCFFFPWYYLPGFPLGGNRAGYAFFFVLLVEMYAVTLGQAIAALSPSMFIAATINPTISIFMTLFCGVTIPRPAIPSFWREWMYNLNPLTRPMTSLVVNAMHQLPINCDPSEFTIFQPPSGQTCDDWAGQFATENRGRIDNPSDTSNCRFCEYTVGDQYYESLGLSFDYRWRDLGIYIGYIVFNVVVAVLACKFLTLRYSKR